MSKHVSLRMAEDVLEAIDRAAKDEQRSRSKFIERTMREALEAKHTAAAEIKRG